MLLNVKLSSSESSTTIQADAAIRVISTIQISLSFILKEEFAFSFEEYKNK